MKLDFDSKELRVFDKEEIFKIHPLWIRERSIEKGEVDQNSFQRLYDPEKIKPDSVSYTHLTLPTRLLV